MFITPKAVDKEFYVTLIVIDEDDITKTKEYYPKSYANGIYLRKKLFGNTFLEHMEDKDELLHPTEDELNLIRRTPEEGGIVKLDSEGRIPIKYTNPTTIALYYNYNTVYDLINSATFELPKDYGRLVMVKDSYGDPRSKNKHKWTLYRYIGPVTDNILSYQVLITELDIDLVFTWDQFTADMQSSIQEIDDMVRLSHSHDNFQVIDRFHIDHDGNLNFRGIPISIREKIQSFVLGKDVEDVFLLNGDMGIQILSVRQIDTDLSPAATVDDNQICAPITTIRGDCSNMFKARTDLTESPRLYTNLMTKADHFFDGCINLESIDWYDFKNVISANYFANDCQSLKSFPALKFDNLENAESFLASSGIINFGDLNAPKLKDLHNFFNNCVRLKSVDNIIVPSVTSIDNMFYNCVSLENLPYIIDIRNTLYAEFSFFACRSLKHVGKIISPKLVLANQMFANCTKLISIEEIDFSSCTSASNIFTGCTELQHVGIKPGTLKTDISFFNTNLTLTSLRKIIKDLPPVNNCTITINYTQAAASITDEEIANARVKGWTIQR